MEGCGNCRFAQPTVHDDGDVALVCRRYPPTVFALDGEPAAGQPDVESSGWCGEWAQS